MQRLENQFHSYRLLRNINYWGSGALNSKVSCAPPILGIQKVGLDTDAESV